MRQLLLATVAFAALSLSACSTIEKWTGDDEATPPPAAAPSAPPTASATEESEMSSLMGTSANPTPPAVPVEGVTADGATPAPTADLGPAPANAPKECPQVEVLPDTKSITYFDDPDGKPSGALVARAVLTDIKGGCDYTKDGVVVDIDMIMSGKITDKGRYQGRKDLEAFMTFPYFVAVMDPSGKMIDKKIMATAMRFKPTVDDLDHAEKITQTIPVSDVTQGPKYTITLGFQLNRAQLEYNRGGSTKAAPASKTPATKSKAPKTSDNTPVGKPVPILDEKVPAKADTPKTDAASDDDRYSKGNLGLSDDTMPSVGDQGADGASAAQ